MLGLGKLRDKTIDALGRAQETIYKVILVLLTVTALLWMSVFLYASFYYSYIPPVSHTRPIHLQFTRSCDRNSKVMCDYPSANVTLTRRDNFLMVGQPYKILVELEMPESPANQNLGMFMICACLKQRNGDVVEESCRSAMLQYKSGILHFISTVVLYPFLLSGSYEEKQVLQVEMFSNFQEDRYNPVTDAFIEFQSYSIEVYRASIKLHAHFTGLRFLMFHWPLTSAVMGICTNLFFLSVIAFLSWFKFFKPHQVIIHVGYDATKATTLGERHTHAKGRIRRKETSSPLPHDQNAHFKKSGKEDLDIDLDENGDGETSVKNSTQIADDEDDQVVPMGKGSDTENFSEEKKSSSEFEVIGDPKASDDEKENPDGVQHGDVYCPQKSHASDYLSDELGESDSS